MHLSDVEFYDSQSKLTLRCHMLVVPWLPKSWGICLSSSLFLVRHDKISRRLVAHEVIHALQYRQHGWFRFVWKYLTSSAFRKSAETEAYIEGHKTAVYAEDARVPRLSWSLS